MRSKFAAILIGAALAASGAGAATFQGEFWDADVRLTTPAEALAVIGSRQADATFRSTGIDYVRGDVETVDAAVTLGAFLGPDAGSLSGFSSTPLTQSVFRFSGFLDLAAGEQVFDVASDDGFVLTIGGVEIGSSIFRRFRSSTFTADPGAGPTPFELVFFENAGRTGIEFLIDGAVAEAVEAPAPIPLPAGLPLLAGALGLLALSRRRR